LLRRSFPEPALHDIVQRNRKVRGQLSGTKPTLLRLAIIINRLSGMSVDPFVSHMTHSLGIAVIDPEHERSVKLEMLTALGLHKTPNILR
jgi:hypothetical protein